MCSGIDAEKKSQNISRIEKTAYVDMCRGKSLNLNILEVKSLFDFEAIND